MTKQWVEKGRTMDHLPRSSDSWRPDESESFGSRSQPPFWCVVGFAKPRLTFWCLRLGSRRYWQEPCEPGEQVAQLVQQAELRSCRQRH